MTEQFSLEIIKQGGFLALAAWMFWMYRNDSKAWAQKQSETAQAFMAFGERIGESMARQSAAMQETVRVLHRIEERFNDEHICPMTHVAHDFIADMANSGGAKRRRIDRTIEENLRQENPDAGKP